MEVVMKKHIILAILLAAVSCASILEINLSAAAKQSQWQCQKCGGMNNFGIDFCKQKKCFFCGYKELPSNYVPVAAPNPNLKEGWDRKLQDWQKELLREINQVNSVDEIGDKTCPTCFNEVASAEMNFCIVCRNNHIVCCSECANSYCGKGNQINSFFNKCTQPGCHSKQSFVVFVSEEETV